MGFRKWLKEFFEEEGEEEEKPRRIANGEMLIVNVGQYQDDSIGMNDYNVRYFVNKGKVKKKLIRKNTYKITPKSDFAFIVVVKTYMHPIPTKKWYVNLHKKKKGEKNRTITIYNDGQIHEEMTIQTSRGKKKK